MRPFGKSQPIARDEDHRFLTGAGSYVDDIAPTNALFGYVFRSPIAHGTITELDVNDAQNAPGVRLVLTADGLHAAGVEKGLSGTQIKNKDGSDAAGPRRPILAEERVRFVGEAVAFIVAETLAQAKDAAEMILFEVDDLPAKVDRAPGGQEIHPEAPGNVAFDWGMGDEAATRAAIDSAAHVVRLEVEDNRVIVNPMEPRGCFAEMNDGRLHFCVNGQGVWGPRDMLADTLGMDPADLHVTTPDVGGGFGMKAFSYPEMVLVAHACRTLGTSVRWMSERSEGMMSDNGGRDLGSVATLAFDADHKITAYMVETTCNLGAYNSGFGQAIQTQLFSRVLTGVYDIQTVWLDVKGIYTNTVQMDAYRGAGRPEAIYLLERMMDRAARELGVSPWDLRRKNFITNFPYDTATGETYDVGDFGKLLTHVADKADVAGFDARRTGGTKARGIGLCYYIESILGDPSETARMEFTETGVRLYVGTQSNGQGHETVYRKFLSDQTGIPPHLIEIVQGDSDLIKTGGGTGGSRSVTTQSTATLATAQTAIAGFIAFLAETEGAEVTFDDERFRIAGSNVSPTMIEAAQMARDAGRTDLLTIEERTTLPGRSFPNGAHVAEVEVDLETGEVTVERYTVVDDFGNLINPALAEGQVHGGVVQGIGQAITEEVFYDSEGQLITATFMDYAMPRADDAPMISFTSDPVPSTANVLGMKGCGEAGTVGALAAVSNAVQDALWDHGVRQADMPFTPRRVWEMLAKAG